MDLEGKRDHTHLGEFEQDLGKGLFTHVGRIWGNFKGEGGIPGFVPPWALSLLGWAAGESGPQNPEKELQTDNCLTSCGCRWREALPQSDLIGRELGA